MTNLMIILAVLVASGTRIALSAIQEIRFSKVSVLFRRGQARWLCRGTRKMLCLNLLVILLVSQGCALTSMEKRTEDEQVATIVIGQSTKNEVLDILGLPNRTEQLSAQEEQLDVWVYYKGKGRRTFAVLIPVPIPVVVVAMNWWLTFDGNITIEEKNKIAVVVAFNESGIAVDVKEQANVDSE